MGAWDADLGKSAVTMCTHLAQQETICNQYYYCPGLNMVILQSVQLEHSDSLYLRG